MCGITSFVGRKKNLNEVVHNLKKLEYRGYDSAGVAWIENGAIKTIKSIGEIKNLETKITQKIMSNCIISHTRWATHGKISEINTHPHVSKNGTWAVVHNGIIENHKALKAQFELNVLSETDTAVISELLEKQKASSIFDFKDAVSLLNGSYALVCICEQNPDRLFFAKNKSPLYVATNEFGEFMIASDPVCFVGFSNKFISLNDGDYGFVELNNIEVFNFNNKMYNPIWKINDVLDIESNITSEKFFMQKEINEEEKILKNLVKSYKNKKILEIFDKDFLCNFKEIMFIGCGTAFHAGLYGAEILQSKLNVHAHAEMASEFIAKGGRFVSNETLCFFISQSGETADTLQALKLAKEKQAVVIGLTNIMHSTLAQKCDYVLPTLAGPEIAVASTKAFVCQMAILFLFAAYFQSNLKIDPFEQVLEISQKLRKYDLNYVENISNLIKNIKKCMFIGTEINSVIAKESALKLKEVSYINAVSYPSGELKHGYLALIDEGFPVIAIALNHQTNYRTINSAIEAETRGANILFITNEKMDFENSIYIDENDEFLASIICSKITQTIAFCVSQKLGINPDKPKNLAKSVTVE